MYFTYITFPGTTIRYVKIPQETLLFVIFPIQLARERKDTSQGNLFVQDFQDTASFRKNKSNIQILYHSSFFVVLYLL
jgi:hypothetical protein